MGCEQHFGMATKRVRKRAVPPDPCEWDFRPIEDWELPFATIYEYARSIEKVSNHLTAWLDGPVETRSPWPRIRIDTGQIKDAGWEMKSPLPDRMGDLIEYIFDEAPSDKTMLSALHLVIENVPQELHGPGVQDIALRFPRFPEPWIQTRQRRGVDYLKKRCFQYPNPVRVLRELWDPFEWDPNNPLRDLHATSNLSAHIGVHEFLIDWSARRTEILADFTSWLGRHHPGQSRRNPHIREPLKWLAAFRLKEAGLAHAAAKEVVKDRHKTVAAPPSGPDLPTYGNEKKWLEAARKAKELIQMPDFDVELLRRHGLLWAS